MRELFLSIIEMLFINVATGSKNLTTVDKAGMLIRVSCNS